LRAQCC